MRSARKSVASGSCSSVGLRLTTGGVFASVGILVSSLVTTPPHFVGAESEVRAVHFAAFTLAPPPPAGALLEKFLSNQSRTLTPVTPVIVAGPVDTDAVDITTAPTFVHVVHPSGSQTKTAIAESRIDPAVSSQAVNNAALASTIDPSQIVGFIVAAGFVVLFVALIPVAAVFGFIGYNVIDPILNVLRDLGVLPELDAAGAPTAALVEENPTSDSLLTNTVAVADETGGLVNLVRAAKTAKADFSPPVASTDPPTDPLQKTSIEPTPGIDQTLTDTATLTNEVTDIVKPEEESTEPKDVAAPADSASPAKPTKPTWRLAKPRSVVRDSLGVGERLRDLAHGRNGLRPTTVAGDDEKTTGSPSISSSPESSKDRDSAGDDPSDGDPGGAD